MFDSIIEETISLGELTHNCFLMIGIALIIGIIISITYCLIPRQGEASINILISTVVLPALIAIVILLISADVAKAFTLAGVCTLVRFRSAQGDAKEITFILLAVTAGLAVGMGYLSFACIFTVIILAALVLAAFFTERFLGKPYVNVRVCISSDLDYRKELKGVFVECTSKYAVKRIKTLNMGTLYEITYRVKLKHSCDEKDFIDKLSEKNGNEKIVIMVNDDDGERL